MLLDDRGRDALGKFARDASRGDSKVTEAQCVIPTQNTMNVGVEIELFDRIT